jgi:hypothetical protein
MLLLKNVRELPRLGGTDGEMHEEQKEKEASKGSHLGSAIWSLYA